MKIIIIGGEAAGMSAAAKAKRIEPNAEIVVYEASKVISFGACGLPYFIGGEFDNAEYMAEFTPEQFATKGITVLTEHRVLSIDDKSQQLTVEHCGETFTTNYDRLMIATGAKEILPPIAGLDRQGVYSLRKMQDGLTIKQALASPTCQHVTVIGSGFIGLEVVEALVNQGKDVRLIERAERLIPDAFEPEISQLLYHELEQAGVNIHLNESVEAVVGDHQVTSIKTDQDIYPTDMVICCTGVKPNTEFLHNTRLERLSNGAIIIDQQGKTSVENIWAAGDCATIWHAQLQKPVYVPLATGANKMGRLVGENLAGKSLQFEGTLATSCVKVLGLEAGRTGLSEAQAQAENIDYRSVFISDKCHTNYCHGQSPLHIKLIYQAQDKKIIGAQMIGYKGAVHRIDALAVAITLGATTDQLGMMDFAYAPPFSRTWDIMNVAGNVAK
ncbi:CoA-disulfide reductase [Photobacterium damselae]|nr:CoA-disulfide reductase [Photobacterium damselae]KAB1511079.1 CoA-disulfide reductase [Photobacterium damselae subsp. damselae]